MAQTTWTPNAKQKLFMEILKGADRPLTLGEISKIAGQEIASGTINCLCSPARNLVKTVDLVFGCDIVRQDTGEIVGTKKHKCKGYSLVE